MQDGNISGNGPPAAPGSNPRVEATRIAEPWSLDSLPQGEAILRLLGQAPLARRRFQFFVWMQSYLQPVLPHEIVVCGAYQRQSRSVALEAFNAVPLPEPARLALTSSEGPLVQGIVRSWVEGGCAARRLSLRELGDAQARQSASMVVEAGFEHWLVHAVARPQRPRELESLFLFGRAGFVPEAHHEAFAEMLLPQLHSTYLRMQATERELGSAPAAPVRTVERNHTVTPRERQILGWIREGKSNQEIGELLGISALTVKNHVQKILRKLGANNRAHAVAMVLSLGLLDPATLNTGGPADP